jgi:soluble lytic murein transglycosylase-like protein
MAFPFLACMLAAAELHHVPPRALVAIQAVEGGQVHMASRNDNGTEDLGPMQVNSSWLPRLAAGSGQDVAQVRVRLLDDPCYNIDVAGAILRLELDEAHGDLLTAVGHYRSHTPELAMAYRARVIQAALSLFYRRRPGPA